MDRIKIIKSTLPTSWYNGSFIGKEFNTRKEHENCFELENNKSLDSGVSYFVMKGDCVKVGIAKGRRRRWFNEYNYNRRMGYTIQQSEK